MFVKELENVGIEAACRLLKGIFFLLVEDKPSGGVYAFVDNSGVFQAFYTDKIVSTSFLELVRNEKHTEVDLDLDAVVEFLHLGKLYSNKIL